MSGAFPNGLQQIVEDGDVLMDFGADKGMEIASVVLRVRDAEHRSIKRPNRPVWKMEKHKAKRFHRLETRSGKIKGN